MEFVLRLLAALATILAIVLNAVLNWIKPRKSPTYPPITNDLLLKSMGDVVQEIRQKKLKSEDLVNAYIARIKEVQVLNAVVEDRFKEALKEAQLVDQLISRANNQELVTLFLRYPLLGVPFTVKESCALKGLSFAVGNAMRMHTKCPKDSKAVELLRGSGCIPLLVSANPEFCLSFETNTVVNGRCLNPYDLQRTSAGSSGGEGTLNGCGATLFGLGSDVAGSIRLPALFCGVFGHKPTGGLVSIEGHFPVNNTDAKFSEYLQLGPITRFAKDLPILLQIIAGDNAEKLKLAERVNLTDIKIYYAYGFSGFNCLFHPPTAFDIKLAITRAVKCFEKGGLSTREIQIEHFKNSIEMCLSTLMTLKGVPSIFTQTALVKPSRKILILEMFRSLFGHSLYTKEAVFMELMQNINCCMTQSCMQGLRKDAENLKKELTELLGTNGVLFFPTFHTSALHFNTSILNLVGVDMLTIFNVLGFPATHVPMGLDTRGLPIGFQVIAAPYQDKLCLQIAGELEGAFGGWVQPV